MVVVIKREMKSLDFVVTFHLLIANTFFRKGESQLVTYSSGQHSSHIDFALTRREDKRTCLDCKVIPRECVVSQYKLVVAGFEIQVNACRDKQTKIARTKW
jgi:aspartyl-tRNA synthetase